MPETNFHRQMPSASPAETGVAAVEIIQAWLALSELSQRAFSALSDEIAASSHLVETSTDALSRDFTQIVELSSHQMRTLNGVIANGQTISVDGATMSLSAIGEFAEDILTNVINTILTLSKHAMDIVYALDHVVGNVNEMEKAILSVENINQKTTFLALNARIESERAGVHGGAFKVVAEEVRELSGQTKLLAVDMRELIGRVSGSLAGSHDILKKIATTDMVEHIAAKEKLQSFMRGLADHNQSFSETVADAASNSAELTHTISQLVTGIQFQDRVKQILGHVVGTLGTLEQAFVDIQNMSRRICPDGPSGATPNLASIERILESCTLSELRNRLSARLTGQPVNDATASEQGTVDFF